jgi:glycosyltransferase involved in cell wall biosynthesis
MSDAKRKRLLYASPFNPMASGISDYSEILIYGLKKYFHITLLIDDYKLKNKRLYKDFDVRIYNRNPRMLKSFDFRVYNIGNNPRFHSYIYESALACPGLIILHDVVLYYLIVGYYQEKGKLFSKITEMAGPWGLHLIKKSLRLGRDLLECKELAPFLPLNSEILTSRNKIMVHSDYAFQRISEMEKKPDLMRKINMVDHVASIRNDNLFIEKRDMLDKYGIPENALIVGSFGYIDKTKLNHVICKVVNALNEKLDNKLVYLMVGGGNYVDEYLGTHIRKTGHVDLAEFNSFIHHVDVVINLRYPSMGETSGAMIRALGLGKPCIVSDDAWFSELPDHAVVKVANENIAEALREGLVRLFENPQLIKELSCNAKAYILREHSLEMVSRKISEFIECSS